MAPLKIITRKEWGALPSKKTTLMTHPIKQVIFSYLECKDIVDLEIVRKAQVFHMEVKNNDDIECSFVIGRDGSVYEGRGWFSQTVEREGTEGGNYLDIGYIGQIIGKQHDDPSLVATLELLNFGVENKYLDEDYCIVGNQDLGSESDRDFEESTSDE